MDRPEKRTRMDLGADVARSDPRGRCEDVQATRTGGPANRTRRDIGEEVMRGKVSGGGGRVLPSPGWQMPNAGCRMPDAGCRKKISDPLSSGIRHPASVPSAMRDAIVQSGEAAGVIGSARS